MSDYFTKTNQLSWDERVAIHLRDDGDMYPIRAFLDGADVLLPIEALEIGDVSGLRVAHLQCHFGLDSLCLARRGADVTGLDFSAPAIEAARALSEKSGLPARFVEANVYDAQSHIGSGFDLVYTTWGAIMWLEDVAGWGRVIGGLLKPGGRLYFADVHPFLNQMQERGGALVVGESWKAADAGPVRYEDAHTYAGDGAELSNRTTFEWSHSLSSIISSLADAGMALEFLHEHDSLPWQHLPMMQPGDDRMYRMPDGVLSPPLAMSLSARKL